MQLVGVAAGDEEPIVFALDMGSFDKLEAFRRTLLGEGAKVSCHYLIARQIRKGVQARVQICLNSVVCGDEPTTILDVGTVKKTWAVMNDIPETRGEVISPRGQVGILTLCSNKRQE